MEKFMNENIFREYDIRGIVKTDFNKDLIIALGKSFGTFLKRNNQNALSPVLHQLPKHQNSLIMTYSLNPRRTWSNHSQIHQI